MSGWDVENFCKWTVLMVTQRECAHRRCAVYSIVVREKQRVLTHICGILENGTDKRTCVQSRNRDTEKKHTVTKGWKEGGMNREMGTDIYTLLCIKQVTNENLLYSSGNSTECSVVT